jgi:DNA modification methylase
MRSNDALRIEYIDISDLRHFSRNARTHSGRQIKQIAESIRIFGFTNPLLVDEARTLLAGHGRLEAAKSLGLSQVPCVRIGEMTPAQKRAYVIADNKLALNAGWDEELLTLELQELLEIDTSFDIQVTGFSAAEIDGLIASVGAESSLDAADDALPPIDADKAISKVGDLWLLAGHRIYCGDSTKSESFETLLKGEKAEMVFTDPPYNVRIGGHVSGLGKVKHREFEMATGEMSSSEFTQFLRATIQCLVRHTTSGSVHFICMDWRHMKELIEASEDTYTEQKNLCVWVKDNGGMGTFYRSQHELIFVFKSGDSPHINNFELGQHGRYRTNVWSYRGMNSRGKSRDCQLAMHPTVKPVAMIADAIRDVSTRGGIVLDCFGGSGSTLIAAQKTARRARLIELDPIYVDRTIQRWQEYAKDEAVLARTGQRFYELTTERSCASEV